MKMLLSIAWRNVWRHPGRSGVLIASIVAGMWAGIMVSSWANGLIDQRVNNVINEDLTHAQIHHPEFLTEREPGMYIEPHDEIITFLESDARVQSYSSRTLLDGMIQSAATTSGVRIIGVDKEQERETTTFHQNLTEGEYLSSDSRNPVFIGEKLINKLNVEIGDRIVLTFQNIENEITSGAFTVSGVFRTGQNLYDEQTVYVNREDLTDLIANRPLYHEIAIMLHDRNQVEQLVSDINRQFSSITAETWIELSPEMRYMTQASGSYMFYIMIVILFALAFGILNTMTMAIFERMRELGMLMAIGMNKLRVFTMIMLESVMLTLTGAAVGIFVGYLTVNYFNKNGLDLTAIGGDSFEIWGYGAVVYPYVNPEEYLYVMILVIATALLAAVYPALKALKLVPGEVVRE
ncbi:ABC transporter permease [Rhodohalobacter sp.]|uniref:ABC transporter permease n=1 Tax=Rhodohalobacter sp. TaxID=1974210 RepID=UPI002ACE069D|nr:FtsX-like permease family protein [Rhodohalobacter sp.]MDZ7758114.1 FtsX-like permease family protein [Rhodohalobacter sp.]